MSPPTPVRPTRRRFLQASAALAALPALGPKSWAAADAGSAARPPNVLFVFSDSHRASSTGCYGDEQAVTPAIDALAASGLRLDSAISNTPLCRPYRASLMSGAYACHTGMVTNVSSRNFGVNKQNQWMPGDRSTLGASFKAAGYRCGYIGKWHLGPVALADASQRLGFDDQWLVARKPAHDYYHWSYVDQDGVTEEGEGRFRPAFETDKALEFIRAGRTGGAGGAATPGEGAEPDPRGGPTSDADDRPWLLVMSWGPPHDPLDPPPGFLREGPLSLPPNVRSKQARRLARADLPRYYALIEAIDQEFGRLVQQLDAMGLSQDTLVIYTSDHGIQLASQNLVGKEAPYSDSTRVPFVLRWPGRIPAGSSLAMPFGVPDILPTLAGLAGLPPPAGVDGLDLSGALLGQPGARRREHTLLSAYETNVVPWPGWRGVRTARHLFARTQQGPWLLYDVVNDPFELDNLVKSQPALRDQMMQRTRELMQEVGDTWGAG